MKLKVRKGTQVAVDETDKVFRDGEVFDSKEATPAEVEVWLRDGYVTEVKAESKKQSAPKSGSRARAKR